jgi:hypothetical protein
MTTEYKAAYDKSAAAIKAFGAIKLAYRGRTIGDAEFMAAKVIYDAAMAEFDVAFEAWQNLPEAIEEAAPAAEIQIGLFE